MPEPSEEYIYAANEGLCRALIAALGLIAAGVIVQMLLSPRADGGAWGGYEELGFSLGGLVSGSYALRELITWLREPPLTGKKQGQETGGI